MALDFPLLKAELVAFFLESLLYGVLVTLYSITVWVLLKRKNGKLNVALLATSTVMFLLSTIHIGIDVYRILEAFTERPSALGFFATLSEPTHVAKSMIWVAQTVVGDCFVIYRAYVVWGRTIWVAVFPFCLVIATAISGFGACTIFIHVTPTTSVFAIHNWITSLFALSLCTNVICTSLVAFRIWFTHRRVRDHTRGKSALWPVMVIVIESGAIYSAGLISLLTTYASGSNGQFPALDADMPLCGVAFNLIIVRVGLGLAQNSTLPGVRSGGAASANSRITPVGRQNTITSGRVHMTKVTTTTRHDDEDIYPLQSMERAHSLKASSKIQQSRSASNDSSIHQVNQEDKWTSV